MALCLILKTEDECTGGNEFGLLCIMTVNQSESMELSLQNKCKNFILIMNVGSNA